MKRCFAAFGLVCLLVLAAPAMSADYEIDTKGGHAAIGFRIPHLGFS